MALFKSTPLLGYGLMGAGLAITTAYSGRAAGIVFELLESAEKTKVSKIGWAQGAALGIIYFAFLLLTGIAMQLF